MRDEQLESLVEVVRRIRHDANGPLTVAIGNIQLLVEDGGLDADAQSSLETVASELHRLHSILGRLDGVRDVLRAAAAGEGEQA